MAFLFLSISFMGVLPVLRAFVAKIAPRRLPIQLFGKDRYRSFLLNFWERQISFFPFEFLGKTDIVLSFLNFGNDRYLSFSSNRWAG